MEEKLKRKEEKIKSQEKDYESMMEGNNESDREIIAIT